LTLSAASASEVTTKRRYTNLLLLLLLLLLTNRLKCVSCSEWQSNGSLFGRHRSRWTLVILSASETQAVGLSGLLSRVIMIAVSTVITASKVK